MLLGFSSNEWKMHALTKPRTQAPTEALFILSQRWKPPKFHVVDDG